MWEAIILAVAAFVVGAVSYCAGYGAALRHVKEDADASKKRTNN